MPCVICNLDTKKGFLYCDPCMKKDMENKKLEKDFEKKRFDEDLMIRNQQRDMVESKNTETNKKREKKLIQQFNKNNGIKDIEVFKPLEIIQEKVVKKNFIQDDKIDNSKNFLLSEMKLITQKVNNMEQMIKDNYSAIYVLVSRDMDQLVHLHGVYSNLDIASLNYKKLTTDADKYSKIIKLEKVILYKTYMDNLDGSFDTALFDDCDMEIIMKKEYKSNDILNRN
jgi:hypothetical protein